MEARTAVSSNVFNVEARTAVSSDVFDVETRTTVSLDVFDDQGERRGVSSDVFDDQGERRGGITFLPAACLSGRRPHEQTNGPQPVVGSNNLWHQGCCKLLDQATWVLVAVSM